MNPSLYLYNEILIRCISLGLSTRVADPFLSLSSLVDTSVGTISQGPGRIFLGVYLPSVFPSTPSLNLLKSQ